MNDLQGEEKTRTNHHRKIKKIAYIVTRDVASEILEANLNNLIRNEPTAQIVGIYFADDGVYQIVKGARISNKIRDALRIQDIFLFADEESLKKRKLQNMLLEDTKLGTLADFYSHTQNADHIVTI